MESKGMSYDNVRKRIKRITEAPGNPKAKANLVHSLLGQVKNGEGSRAEAALRKEFKRE